MSSELTEPTLRWKEEVFRLSKDTSTSGTRSRLGVDFVRSLKPQLRVPKHGDVHVVVKQAQGGDQLGAVVWDCAELVCEFLLANRYIVQGKRVLELGSGTGVVGLFAAKLDPALVILSDIPEMLPLIKENMNLNECDETRSIVKLRSLKWGSDISNVLDDGEQDDVSGFEMIICSDTLYAHESFDALKQTLLAVTSRGSIVVFGYKIRYESREELFLSELSAIFDIRVQQTDISKSVFVLTAQRRGDEIAETTSTTRCTEHTS